MFRKISFNRNPFAMSSTSIENLSESFANILKIYENDSTASFAKYLTNRKYRPIANFGKDMDWFNTQQSLTLHDNFAGKVLLLDFFTYCCINCMHILPHLDRLEHEFGIDDGFVVVGVHCAKFENEKRSENIRRAIERYTIRHPVVNDHEFKVWKSCNIRCWPSLLLLDPEHRPIGLFQGEGHHDLIRFCVAQSLRYFDSVRKLSKHSIPVAFRTETLTANRTRLAYPSKIASFFDPVHGFETIAISDTGNNRVLICDTVGNLVLEIGSGTAGFKDGSFNDCQFNKPYGLVFRHETELIVADCENHAIRAIDLHAKQVRTLVGTGSQGHDYSGGGRGVKQAISSPWDVALFDRDVLLIAMAGTHQIWAYFMNERVWWKGERIAAETCCSIAGSGREENRNNHYPKSAAFAQPSGLCLDRYASELFIADSESSAIRKLSLDDGKVSAVVGADKNPQNLFAFGDQDGKLTNAKLQHPLGVATACGRNPNESLIFVADSYNHRIKVICDGAIERLRLPEPVDSSILNEPHGLCVSQRDPNRLLVCDTNNHRIRIFHIEFAADSRRPHCRKIDDFHVRAAPNGFLPFNNTDVVHRAFNCARDMFALTFNFIFESNFKLNDSLSQLCDVSLLNGCFEIVKFDSNLKLHQNEFAIRVKDRALVANRANFVHLKCNLNLCNNEICCLRTLIVVLVLSFDGDDDGDGATKEISIRVSERSVRLEN